MFREIKETNLCPNCGTRLYYRSMPPRCDADLMRDISALKHNWYCSKCDKYFEKIEEKEDKK